MSGTTSSNLQTPGSSSGLLSDDYRKRETGVIEKLLKSYGFIECAEREDRLFFHYSQFHGISEMLHKKGKIVMH